MGRQYYSDITAGKIRACLRKNPGIKAKDIGQILGLTRRTINSYLYSTKPGAIGKDVYQDSNYGWHLKGSSHRTKEPAKVSNASPRRSARHSNQPPTVGAAQRPMVNAATRRSGDRTQDRYISVQVALREAFQGSEITVQDGNQSIKITIPPNTRPGKLLRLDGRGSALSSGQRGNLYCWIKLHPKTDMTLSGDDVIYQTSIDQDLAERGGSIEVPTVQGTAHVQVPAGIKSGTKLRLANRGWFREAGGRGDQYVHLEIQETTRSYAQPSAQTVYTPEVIQEVFRDDDYALLSDEEQSKLAEMLERAELVQRGKQDLTTAQKSARPLAVISSGWFWFAIAMGGIGTYAGLQLYPELLPSSPAPIEQQSP